MKRKSVEIYRKMRKDMEARAEGRPIAELGRAVFGFSGGWHILFVWWSDRKSASGYLQETAGWDGRSTLIAQVKED